MLRERPQMDYADYEMKLKAKSKNAEGHEVPDPTPIAPPVGYKEFPSMIEQVQKMVRDYHLQMELAAQGAETFEEANDFDVDEDPEPQSIYEDVDEDRFVPDLATNEIDRGSLPTGEGKGQGEKAASAAQESSTDSGSGNPAATTGGGEPPSSRLPPSPKK